MGWIFPIVMTAAAALAMPARATDVKLHGRAVHYNVQGTGPTIIFVHGWTCDETSWSGQVPAFAGRYRVVTLDLPGHGNSDLPARNRFTMKLFSDAVEAVRAAVRADRIVLVGHSMGAVVIRQYALDHPGHVAGLVAVDGPLDIRAISLPPGSLPPMTVEMRGQLVGNMFVPETSAALRERITAMMLGTSQTTAAGASPLMFDPALRSDRTIPAPALTVYAGKPLFPIDPHTREMLPGWQQSQVEGTGHFLMMEKPEAFNRLLADFLDHRARY
ncbi:hypothetical protein ASE00_09955 [Sphingomonas sp. Root710]|uniref:alpha/beta fold hydrolase n=1 Tax=Sphingomonas sp. Root710 TaxID=1736594 RepID=UPI0006F67EC9|nr:alpha/beta hydrolase [Sphingomonas sp. Root710]KRB82382.1 hypothetical protein ASE00_09955 [Sphingomonas sp. Root710]